MSESDSAPATNSDSSADKNPANPAPYMKKKPDDSNESTHGYFIPVIMVLVLGVIIIATFYSKEFNSLVASIMPADDGSQLTASVKEKFYAKTNAVPASENTGTTTTGADNTSETSAHPVNVTDSALSATTSAGSAGASATEQTTEKGSPAAPESLTAVQNQPAYPAYMNRYAPALPYAPPPPVTYAMPGEWNAHNELMEQRRQAYEQAQREHQKRLHEYRAAVMKRIEQDRQDMFRHMQELAQQSQKRRDEYLNRLEQFEKTSMDRPI